jgi:hypothetical protein
VKTFSFKFKTVRRECRRKGSSVPVPQVTPQASQQPSRIKYIAAHKQKARTTNLPDIKIDKKQPCWLLFEQDPSFAHHKNNQQPLPSTRSTAHHDNTCSATIKRDARPSQACAHTADAVRANRQVGQPGQVAHRIECACNAPPTSQHKNPNHNPVLIHPENKQQQLLPSHGLPRTTTTHAVKKSVETHVTACTYH